MALRFLQDVSQQAGLKPKELRAVHERWVHQRAVPLLTAAFSYSRCGAGPLHTAACEQLHGTFVGRHCDPFLKQGTHGAARCA